MLAWVKFLHLFDSAPNTWTQLVEFGIIIKEKKAFLHDYQKLEHRQLYEGMCGVFVCVCCAVCQFDAKQALWGKNAWAIAWNCQYRFSDNTNYNKYHLFQKSPKMNRNVQ